MRELFRMPDIFEEMRKMQEDMKRLMQRMQPLVISSAAIKSKAGKELKVREPITTLKQTETHVIADIELPGMEKEDINLHVTSHKIEIRAAKRQEISKKGEYACSERSYYRSFSLPAEVDADNTEAVYKNGVLHLKMPKTKISAAKKILIK